MKRDESIAPDWRWGTAEGSRELDRILDRRLTFREKLEWLEEAENVALLFRANRERRLAEKARLRRTEGSTAADL